MNLIIGFYFLIIGSFVLNSHVILPFKKQYSPQPTKDNVFDSLKMNYVSVELGFGTPKQSFQLNLRMDLYPTWIIGSSCEEGSSIKFNQNQSSTYAAIRDFSINYSGEDFGIANKCNETLAIGDLNKSDFMVMISEKCYNLPVNSGSLGLHFQNSMFFDTQDMNLIYQLKKAEVISSYAFTIRYSQYGKGELIIGDYLHAIDRSYSSNHFAKAKTAKIYSLVWGLQFDEITWNNTILSNGTNAAYLRIEYGFILVPSEVKKHLESNFFNHYVYLKKCKVVSIQYSEKGYECDRDIDLTTFPEVNFYQKEMDYTFTLSKDDLFYEANKKKHFLIVFTDNNISWILGEPFMRKYTLTFDQDKKIVGFYKERVFYLGYWSWGAIVLFILLLCGVITYVIILNIKKKPKKTRVYEMGDMYEYVPFPNK